MLRAFKQYSSYTRSMSDSIDLALKTCEHDGKTAEWQSSGTGSGSGTTVQRTGPVLTTTAAQ